MLASAAQRYLNHHAALPGKRAVLFTNNDGAYEAAHDIVDAGGTVAARGRLQARACGARWRPS